MKIKISFFLSLILIALISFGCGSDEAPAPADTADTVEATSTQTDASPTPTAAAESETLAGRVLVDLNVRQGPGTNYTVVKTLPANTEITVIGRNEASSWLVAAEDGTEVWLSGSADFVELDRERLADLPVVEAPAPSYNASDPNVNNVLNRIPLVLHNPDSFTCVSNAGINNLSSLAEGNVIGPHSGDFVHQELSNVLFKYTNGSLVLIREDPVARFENGQESLPLATALKMFETGEIVWTGQFGEWPARGVTGCDPQAQP